MLKDMKDDHIDLTKFPERRLAQASLLLLLLLRNALDSSFTILLHI